MFIVTHAGCIAAGVVGHLVASVCLFVHTLKVLELSTPNLEHIYSMVVARHALTQGQRSRSHGY